MHSPWQRSKLPKSYNIVIFLFLKKKVPESARKITDILFFVFIVDRWSEFCLILPVIVTAWCIKLFASNKTVVEVDSYLRFETNLWSRSNKKETQGRRLLNEDTSSVRITISFFLIK
jgi:hypothetical protein